MQHCEKVRAKQCDRDRSTRGMVEGELSVAVALVGSKAGLDSCGSAKIFRDRQLFPASLLLFQLSREKFLKTLSSKVGDHVIASFRVCKNDAGSFGDAFRRVDGREGKKRTNIVI